MTIEVTSLIAANYGENEIDAGKIYGKKSNTNLNLSMLCILMDAKMLLK